MPSEACSFEPAIWKTFVGIVADAISIVPIPDASGVLPQPRQTPSRIS